MEPQPICEALSRTGRWGILLEGRLDGDFAENCAMIRWTLPWIANVGGKQWVLCEDLQCHGLALLTFSSQDEARQRYGQIRASRIRARLFSPDGAQVLPPARSSRRVPSSPSIPEAPGGGLLMFPHAGKPHRSAAPHRQPGVYETPGPLVRYMVRSVHELLQSRFGRTAGLADPGVRVLDPAAGNANFLLAAWRFVAALGAEGERRAIRRDHLVPHFTGYEVLPALHEQGLVELCCALGSFKHRLAQGGQGPRLFLRDALAPSTLDALADGEIAVVLGNPPWCGHSLNRSPWIQELLRGYTLPDGRSDEGYFRIDGEPLGERSSKWLQDDYVQFLRLAQWLIDQKGAGIAALVLNHNCFEAPTFRALRHSLMATFDEIYALDLHGSRRRQEKSPDGRADENVFWGVAQGAAVLFLVKRRGLRKRVLRGDGVGSREEKLRALHLETLKTTGWREIEPRAPLFLFAPQDWDAENNYAKGLSLPEIFPVHGSGVITGRDALLTGLDRKSLEERLAREVEPGLFQPSQITTFLARPFDLRYLFYDTVLLERPRCAVMSHLRAGENLALVVTRQSKEEPGALVTCWITGHKVVSAHDPSSLFPLYLRDSDGGERPNLRPILRERLSDTYGEALTPEAVLAYVYAVLYSPLYRRLYREPLRRSFPRIGFPRDGRLFHQLSQLGQKLIGLHRMRDPRLGQGTVTLAGEWDRPLGKGPQALRYNAIEGRLYLNGCASWLEGLEPEVWEYRVGGYAVLRQWLRARAGRVPGYREARELRGIAEALRLTVKVQHELAATYSRIEADGYVEGCR